MRYCGKCELLNLYLEIPILGEAQEFSVLTKTPDNSTIGSLEICLGFLIFFKIYF